MTVVLMEVFAEVFRPYYTLPKGTLRWFKAAFVSLILLTTPPCCVFQDLLLESHEHGYGAQSLLLDRLLRCLRIHRAILYLFWNSLATPHLRNRRGFLLLMSVDLFIDNLIATYGLAGIAAPVSVSRCWLSRWH